MVIFNDPVPVENPALQAVLMALDMRAAIGGLIEKWRGLVTTLASGSASRMALRRWEQLDLRVGEITRRSEQYRTSRPAFAMKPSPAKSLSAREFGKPSRRL